MTLDQSTRDLLAAFAQTPAPPLHEMTPADARKVGAGLAKLYGAGPQMHQVYEQSLGSPGTEFMVRVLAPTASPRGVVVFYHGGGWVLGSIDEYDTLGRVLAARTGATVVLVDYRLAPEHPYPGAVDDAWLALKWVSDSLDFGPVIVMGDSAGGNLAAVVAQRARLDESVTLSAQVLIYPVTDSDLGNASYLDPENQLMLNRDSMIWFWDHYAAPVARAEIDAAPLKAADFSGLPPAVVITAEHDVLRDEGEAYADRLEQAGVPVARKRFEGQMHGFFSMVGLLPGNAVAIDYVVAQLEPYLQTAVPTSTPTSIPTSVTSEELHA
jgi:acetyl esterase